MRQGTIVDATLIAAPSSTKNKAGQRDPEMHQTKKGNQWYFGMKVHAGVDKDSGLIHSVVVTAANVHDLTPSAQLLHGDEEVVYAMLPIRTSPNSRRWREGQSEASAGGCERRGRGGEWIGEDSLRFQGVEFSLSLQKNIRK